jgi:hypothetical protein
MKQLSNVLTLTFCHVMLPAACSLDSELSPAIEADAVTDAADDLDAGMGEDQDEKRAAKKIAPAISLRDAGTSAKMPATNPDPHAAARGPYYEHEPWNGYLWVAKTGKGTTLTSSQSFRDESFDAEVCIKGSVVATADSSSNAMLGMNVNQAERLDAVPLTLAASLDGVQVEIKNRAGSPLRIQVAAPDGTTKPDARWCAQLSGSGGFIPWTAFNTACWDGSGTPYRHEQITVAMLLVPGNPQAAVSYDFCLRHLAESAAPMPGVGAGSAPPDDEE